MSKADAADKREKAALAAEERAKDWRQGGSLDTNQNEKMKRRREKDILLGKIEAMYASKGETAPIGLASCDIEQLRKHMHKF